MLALGPQLTAYLPQIGAALAILVVGLGLAHLAARGAMRALGHVRFDLAAGHVGVTRLLEDSGLRHTPTGFAGRLVFWAIVVLTLLAALGPLGLTFLATALNQLLLYAPRALAAALSLLLGTTAAGLLAELTVRGLAEIGVTRTAGLRAFVRFGIIFIAAVLAAAVLGIDVTLLIAITVVMLGAGALAAALAIGFGLRGLSANIAASRYVAEGLAAGDHIRLDGAAGTVERIGHALTTVRGADGRAFLIPNAYFLDHVVEKAAVSGDPPGGPDTEEAARRGG